MDSSVWVALGAAVGTVLVVEFCVVVLFPAMKRRGEERDKRRKEKARQEFEAFTPAVWDGLKRLPLGPDECLPIAMREGIADLEADIVRAIRFGNIERVKMLGERLAFLQELQEINADGKMEVGDIPDLLIYHNEKEGD